MRRRMMMRKLSSSSEILYSVQDGDAPFTDGALYYAKIEDGIISIKHNSGVTYFVYGYFNITDLSQNTENALTIDNVANKPTLFVIPANASCKLTIEGTYTCHSTYAEVGAILYEANSSNIIGKVVAKNGLHGMMETEWVQESTVEVGCVAIRLRDLSWGTIFTGTVTLEINGQRYI